MPEAVPEESRIASTGGTGGTGGTGSGQIYHDVMKIVPAACREVHFGARVPLPHALYR